MEDEGLSRKRIENMVENHARLNLIRESARNGSDALKKIQSYKPDLIFMDIDLKDSNAFEILEKLSPLNSRVIFVTAFSDYAVRAFEIEAVDYLLKPFSSDRFNKAVNRAISRENYFNIEEIRNILNARTSQNSSKLIIPEGNTQHFFDGDKIEYICAQGYYVTLIMNRQKKLLRISLKFLEEILSSNFFRINKSTIVNRFHIKELVRHKNSIRIIMNDKSEFYVTDTYRNNVEFFLH